MTKYHSIDGFDTRKLEKAKHIYEEITGKKIEDLSWDRADTDLVEFNKVNPHGMSFANSKTISVMIELLKRIE